MTAAKRRARRASLPAATPASDDLPSTLPLVVITVAAFVVRVLFVRATPDAAWAYSALFKGDAPLWIEAAQALQRGLPFELGLPIHPPGTRYLVALLWDGTTAGIPALRLVWALLGAIAVALVVVAARRSFGPRVALAAGVFCCLSTGLILLSASVDSEMPYLVLVLATLALFEDVRQRSRPAVLAAWGGLHAVACLFRVEHALYFGLVVLLLAVLWMRADGAHVVRRLAIVAAAFVLALVPWHAHAWSAVARFNHEGATRGAAEEASLRAIEDQLSEIPWDADAQRSRDALPAFARRPLGAFVTGTVLVRGREQVRAADLTILDEAFGHVPRTLARRPFVSIYGPLNFALANHPGASGGFDRTLLDTPPRLLGGPTRYPRTLVEGLPPERLSFDYPPHVQLVNDGYSLGAAWIPDQPTRFVRLAARKVSICWSGAALGFTGYGLPLGVGGVRRAVDLTTAGSSALTVGWRLLLLVGCLAGVATAWRVPALHAWLLLALSKLAVTVLFFGYARQGATLAPVCALLLALAGQRFLTRAGDRKLLQMLGLILTIGLAVELARFARPPRLRVDGLTVSAVDPVPADVHRDAQVDVD